MATVVRVDGEMFPRRSPLGAWLLAYVTGGIYAYVWYYRVNDEARRFLADRRNRPGLALLAALTLLLPGTAFVVLLILAFSGYRGEAAWLPWLLWGGLVVSVSGLVSFYRTGLRVRRMEEKAGVARRASPLLAVVLWLLAFAQVPYLQWHLNRVWDSATGTGPGRTPPGHPRPVSGLPH